jgi:hypothetical protein
MEPCEAGSGITDLIAGNPVIIFFMGGIQIVQDNSCGDMVM